METITQFLQSAETIIIQNLAIILAWASVVLVIIYKEFTQKRTRKNIRLAMELVEKQGAELKGYKAAAENSESERRRLIIQLKNERKKSNQLIQRLESELKKVNA